MRQQFGRRLVQCYMLAMLGVVIVGWCVLGLKSTAGEIPAAAVAETARDDRVVMEQFAGSGEWRRASASAEQNRAWRVHAVRRDDGSVKGKLSVLGVPGMQDVRIEGQIMQQDAFGVLLDERGTQVATFNAKLSPDGSGGSFILGSGDSGTWEYDARTKAAVQAQSDPVVPAE